jgi:hypothetical protein
MQQHIGIRMAKQTLRVRNIHTTDDQIALSDQCMTVITLPYAER